MSKYRKNKNINEEDDDEDNTTNLSLKIIALIVLTVVIGTLGFILYEGSSLIDSFQNAVFVFTTTGIINPVVTPEGKVFSSIYNIITSIFVILIISLLFDKLINN